jgi:phage tail-like protein
MTKGTIGDAGYFYLNVPDGSTKRWPSFSFRDLEVAQDGTLTVSYAPKASGAAGPGDPLLSVGVFAGGPFEALEGTTPWYRLQLSADPLPEGTHVQLFTHTADGGIAPPDLMLENPFPAPEWQAAQRDALDMLILNPPARFLWVGGIVRSDRESSPTLRQIRVDYGRDTYLTFLPAMYGEQAPSRDLLERFLSLSQSVLGDLEDKIADLPLLFDPAAAPAGRSPSWLSWLAGWLAFDLNEYWKDGQTRRYLAEAFALYGKRGTIEGLRRYLKIYAGVEARIVEPARETSLWSLGEVSSLGFTTMLAPGELQGAVLDSSATLDGSHLTQIDELGGALFDDLAHRFYVQIYCAELTRPGALDDARAVIEREKPAHTDYHLCVIQPRMRVGAQARVGIDTIVAKGPPPAQLGMVLDQGMLLQSAEDCAPTEVT